MRPGLTRLELLVLVGVCVVALGVAATVVQQLRKKAHEATCANNLKLLGEAIHHFEGTAANHKVLGYDGPTKGRAHQFLPAARIADGYATWAVQIAPYLVGDAPLHRWDLTRPYIEQSDEIRQTVLREFFCPARVRDDTLSFAAAKDAAGALGDYACASGDGNPKFDWRTQDANGAIILGEIVKKDDAGRIVTWRARTSVESLKRGLAYTILLGEKHVPPEGLGRIAFGDGSLYDGRNPASFARVGGPGFGLAPDPEAPFNDNFGSSHSGMCQFLNADNSIRKMATSVNELVLGRLMLRD